MMNVPDRGGAGVPPAPRQPEHSTRIDSLGWFDVPHAQRLDLNHAAIDGKTNAHTLRWAAMPVTVFPTRDIDHGTFVVEIGSKDLADSPNARDTLLDVNFLDAGGRILEDSEMAVPVITTMAASGVIGPDLKAFRGGALVLDAPKLAYINLAIDVFGKDHIHGRLHALFVGERFRVLLSYCLSGHRQQQQDYGGRNARMIGHVQTVENPAVPKRTLSIVALKSAKAHTAHLREGSGTLAFNGRS